MGQNIKNLSERDRKAVAASPLKQLRVEGHGTSQEKNAAWMSQKKDNMFACVPLMGPCQARSYCHRRHGNGPESRQNTGVLGVNSNFIYSAWANVNRKGRAGSKVWNRRERRRCCGGGGLRGEPERVWGGYWSLVWQSQCLVCFFRNPLWWCADAESQKLCHCGLTLTLFNAVKVGLFKKTDISQLRWKITNNTKHSIWYKLSISWFSSTQ